jgi:peptidoglycan hydrolase-like protein with peptidoglycan-binding domain
LSGPREDLLQPTLTGAAPAAAPYSVQTTFLTGFFGGPFAALAILAMNSFRLRRLARDALVWGALLVLLAMGGTSYRQRISSGPGARGRYPAARAQGARAARFAKAAASDLGLRKGSTLWYDLEWFRAYRHRCRTSALHFLSAWTEELHRGGYVSGVYSSVSAGIAAAGEARGHARYTLPDRVWFAWSNGRHDVSWGRYLRAPGWRVDRRVHQYALDVRASYGGVSMAIDRNFVDLGSSPEVRSAPALCGRTADRRSYPTLRRGSRGPVVRVADCLLEAGGHLDGVVDGAFELATARAVRSFQRSRGMKVNGRLDERVWSALLTRGPRTVLKRGSEGGTVRRVQRALTAALPGAVAVHGHFGPGTASAVRRFQDRAGLRVTGIVNPATWHALSTGDITQPKPKRPHGKGKAHRPPKRHGAHQQGKGKADQLKHKVGKHAHRHPKRPHRR